MTHRSKLTVCRFSSTANETAFSFNLLNSEQTSDPHLTKWTAQKSVNVNQSGQYTVNRKQVFKIISWFFHLISFFEPIEEFFFFFLESIWPSMKETVSGDGSSLWWHSQCFSREALCLIYIGGCHFVSNRSTNQLYSEIVYLFIHSLSTAWYH